MEKKTLGRFGEEQAAKYLKSKGYKILDTNFICRFGELDIVAQKDGFVVFVEVKLRKDSSHGHAREFVTRPKQQRVITAAQLWMVSRRCEAQPRFDVIEIYAPRGMEGQLCINHLENAF